MKTGMIFLLVSAAAILLTGCGYYGMGRHHNGNWYHRTSPGTGHMYGNPVNSQDRYMNENSMQNPGVYGR